MTNEQLLNKVQQEYEARKAEINKDLHDYNYYELYMLYELCEWLETLVNEYADLNKDLIEHLKTKNNPLDWLYEAMQDREDEMWDNIGMTMDYQMRWEKDHEVKGE